MKINETKIKKYQAGGFMVYQPLPLQPPQAGQGNASSGAAPATSSGQMDDTVLDKKVVEKLMGNGVTNDIMAFTEEVEKAYQEYGSMSELERSSSYGRQLRNVMKGDLSIVNQLLRNKSNLDTAAKQADSNMAMADLAITNNGLLIKDLKSGQVGEVTHAEFASKYRGSDQYRALTNAELLNEREYNPLLVNDTKSLQVLNNAIGTVKVKEEITKILGDLGSESNSLSKESYIYYGANTPEQLQTAARELIGMGQEGFYKVSQMTETKSNERHLKAAQDVMWTNLSNQAKSLLRAKAASEGADKNNLDATAKEFAMSLLNINLETSTSSKTTADFEKEMTKSAGGGGGDALTDEVKFWGQIASEVGDMQTVEVDLGNGDYTQALGFSPGMMMTDGKPIGKTSLRNITELGGVIDRNSVSIGGNKVPLHKIDAVIYDGAEVTRIKFPAKKDRSGALVPDFDRAEQYNTIKSKLRELPNVAAREELIIKSGFQSDGKGGLAQGEEADFIVFDGMVNENAMGRIEDKRLLREVESNERDLYKQLYIANDPNSSTKGKYVGSSNDFKWHNDMFGSNDVYRGRVFIALRPETLIAGRNLDGKGLNTTKAMQTPEFLGQGTKNRSSSGAGNNGIKYSL